jgi:subfamily B ATP-binding cassette protein MsbA
MTLIPQASLLWKAVGPFKKRALFLLAVLLVTGFVEALGIGMIIPLLTIVLGDSDYLGNTSGLLTRFSVYLRSLLSQDRLLVGMIIVVLGLYLVKTVLVILRTFFMVQFSNLVRGYWMSGILERYLFADYSELVSQKRGVLLNNLANEPLNAHRAMRRIIVYLSELTAALGMYVVMLVASWKLTLGLTAAAFPIVALLWGLIHRYSLSVGRKTLHLNQWILGHAEESLNALREVKAYALERQMLRIFNKRVDELLSIVLRFRTYIDVPAPIAEFLVILFLAAGLLYAEYLEGGSARAMIPLLGFFVIASHRLYVRLSRLISESMNIVSYLPSLQLVHDLMPDRQQGKTARGGIPVQRLEGDIVLDGVSYSYPSAGGSLFEKLSMRFPKGKVIGIIGRSGGGKSTLADLLCGLYPDYEGSIRVGKHDLRELDPSSWHRLIGLVTQEPFIFNTTIRENIMLSRPEASEDEMVAAAKKAYAHEFIARLPQGYDTVVSDRGALSVGQKQRIAIARAILRRPDLYIFDEATSALDPESEGHIRAFIEEARGEKTVIFITHRHSSIEAADVIYVLDHGRVVGSGSYRDLKLAVGGVAPERL